jgi:hypothetical protein
MSMHMDGPRPVPTIGPVRRWDAGHAPAPLPKLPLTPPGLSPVGKEGFCIPPMSSQGR